MPALSAERAAGALRNRMAPRAGLLRTQSTKDQINPGLSLWLETGVMSAMLDEKRGPSHLLPEHCVGIQAAGTIGRARVRGAGVAPGSSRSLLVEDS